MRIYVASSWRNDHQPMALEILRQAGHEVYDFKNPEPGDNGFHWSEIDGGWKSWNVEQYRQALDHTIAEDGFGKDFRAMEWADACVLVMPCGRSAHLEAGWFCGQGKPCVFWYPPGVMLEPELMVKMGDGVLSGVFEIEAWAAAQHRGRHGRLLARGSRDGG